MNLETLINQIPLPSWILIIFILVAFLWKIFTFYKTTQETNGGFKTFIKSHNELVNKFNELTESYTWLTFLIERMIYGYSKSPIKLRAEYKEMIEKSGLDKELDEKENYFLDKIRTHSPKTPLDVQPIIELFIPEIEKGSSNHINEFKKMLYSYGEPIQAIKPILSLYLFEKLIPKIKFE